MIAELKQEQRPILRVSSASENVGNVVTTSPGHPGENMITPPDYPGMILECFSMYDSLVRYISRLNKKDNGQKRIDTCVRDFSVFAKNGGPENRSGSTAFS